mmetsp:Transcript_11346/g.16671  ORF Transcript_11346/g.16671 Transcript_11346/m.16671 type:complete len:158 (-) Transcript_11346:121-594(-)
MDPGWFVLFLFLIVEIILVTLLCLPVPSNDVRGAITTFVINIWENKQVQYFIYFILIMDVIYFYFVFHALLNPFYDLGILSPVEMGISCEQKQDLFYNERNAYITGGSLFLFFILNRLVDIQEKLHQARKHVKTLSSECISDEGSGGGGSLKTKKEQ